MKYFQKNSIAKNTTQTFGLMCFRNIIAGKKAKYKKGSKTLQILLKAAKHPKKYGKANRKKDELETNNTEKENVEKKNKNPLK